MFVKMPQHSSEQCFQFCPCYLHLRQLDAIRL